MKTLVVFYSRTGTTKKVGENIAKILKCDSEEIFDTKDRMGVVGYMQAGKDAMFKNAEFVDVIEYGLLRSQYTTE